MDSCGLAGNDLDAAEGFRTLAHELAHEKLHWQGEREAKTIRELEADATAFVVCRHFGLHADSAAYWLLYDATTEVLLQRLETVRRTAAEIIGLIEDELGAAVPATEAANERALRQGGRLFSRYKERKAVKFYIITEADRSATTVLLPEDY